MSDFWQKYLTVWSAVVVLFGLSLYGGGYAGYDAVNSFFYELTNNTSDPIIYDPYLRLTCGLLGAVTAGWGITFYAAFQASFALEKSQAARIWKLILAGTTFWFVIDNLVSYSAGFNLNILSNTIFYILLLIPILKTGVLKAD